LITKSTPTINFFVPAFIETAWDQGSPYNLKMPTNGACSQSYYPVGCTAVAIGQAMAYYGICNSEFDFDLLTGQQYIYPWSDITLQNEVSDFLKYVADEIDSDYGCTGTASSYSQSGNFLNACGYSYDYDKTNDITASKLFWFIS
jgi:hypothetical protein